MEPRGLVAAVRAALQARLRELSEAATSSRERALWDQAELLRQAVRQGEAARVAALYTDIEAVDPLELPRRVGDVFHIARIGMGLVHLDDGDIAQARRLLLHATDVPGGAVLNSFGPDLFLADRLLQQGERVAVGRYLHACRRHWRLPLPVPGVAGLRSTPSRVLARWSEALERGEDPDWAVQLFISTERWVPHPS